MRIENLYEISKNAQNEIVVYSFMYQTECQNENYPCIFSFDPKHGTKSMDIYKRLNVCHST